MDDTSKKITTDYFNKTAEDYDTSHDGKFVQCMYREILARVPDTRGQRLLDLGCGNGNILKTLNERILAEYYGLDISEKMIEEAGKKLGRRRGFRWETRNSCPIRTIFLMWWFAMLPSTITRTRKRPLQKWAES